MSRSTESSNLLAGAESPYHDLQQPGGQELELLAPARQDGCTSYPNPTGPSDSISEYIIHSNSEVVTRSERELDDVDSSKGRPESRDYKWSPGVWRRLPYKAVLAIVGYVGCTAASIAVLVRSNGKPTSAWTLSPTVYLAFFTSGANMLAHYAFRHGVRIRWWRRALLGGTVRDLHNHWQHADSFWSALFSGQSFGLVALACIAVTVMVIDGPLLQRASSVRAVRQTSLVNVTALVAPEIPWGYTGYVNAGLVLNMQEPMISALNDYNSHAPIITNFSGCDNTSTCTGYVEAGGLAAKCNTVSVPTRFPISGDIGTASPFSVEALYSTVANASDQIKLSITYTNNSDLGSCSGISTHKICYLAPATLKYPVTLSGNTLTLGDVLRNGTTVSFQPRANTTTIDAGFPGTNWTLGGVLLAVRYLFSANATYTFDGLVEDKFMSLPDTLSYQFLDFKSQVAPASFLRSVPSVCASNWVDPTSFILSAINSMAFRLSLSAWNEPFRDTKVPPGPQLVTMLQTKSVTVFHSDYRFLIASTVLMTVIIIIVSSTLVGFSELGRRVTLNPIETAKAFDAPSLQGPGSNAPLRELIGMMGARRLRWGEVDDEGAGQEIKRRLVIADPTNVGNPLNKVAYT